jgi:hypothetical protein
MPPLMHGVRQCQPRLEFFTSHLLTNTWLSLRNYPQRPKSVLKSTLELSKTESGTRQILLSLLGPSTSSRTPVTKSSASSRYRFCTALPSESPHVQHPAPATDSWTWSRFLTRLFSWLCARSVRRHPGGVADCRRRDLLLPLCRIKCTRGLHQDV